MNITLLYYIKQRYICSAYISTNSKIYNILHIPPQPWPMAQPTSDHTLSPAYLASLPWESSCIQLPLFALAFPVSLQLPMSSRWAWHMAWLLLTGGFLWARHWMNHTHGMTCHTQAPLFTLASLVSLHLPIWPMHIWPMGWPLPTAWHTLSSYPAHLVSLSCKTLGMLAPLPLPIPWLGFIALGVRALAWPDLFPFLSPFSLYGLSYCMPELTLLISYCALS